MAQYERLDHRRDLDGECRVARVSGADDKKDSDTSGSSAGCSLRWTSGIYSNFWCIIPGTYSQIVRKLGDGRFVQNVYFIFALCLFCDFINYRSYFPAISFSCNQC